MVARVSCTVCLKNRTTAQADQAAACSVSRRAHSVQVPARAGSRSEGQGHALKASL